MKKYEIIFKKLEEDILKGHYQMGDYLPPEMELSQTYASSRDTVRKALQLLTKAGFIKTVQGRGSQIIKRERINFPVSQLTNSW